MKEKRTSRQEYMRERYLKQREQLSAEAKRKRREDPEWAEKQRARGNEDYKKNKAARDAKNKRNYLKNKDRVNERAKEWRRENIDHVRKLNKRPQVRAYHNRVAAKGRETLDDKYIKALILDNYTGSDRASAAQFITPEMIAFERERIRLKRLVDEMKKGRMSPAEKAKREASNLKKRLDRLAKKTTKTQSHGQDPQPIPAH